MKPILILGNGFIGSNISDFFSQKNIQHEIYSNQMLGYTDMVTYENFLKSKKDKFFCVINTSGYTGIPNVDGCETNKQECWQRNVININNIVKISNDNTLPVIQIGSGCIYSGYDKDFEETDEPNFGLYSDTSSFYSKCKHASEILLDNTWVYILRIRIPFTHKPVRKNYISKLLAYDNLISMENSLTSVSDLCNFIVRFLLLIKDIPGGIYNVVNKGTVSAKAVVDIMRAHGLNNPNWKFVELDQIEIKANRSNCVLSTKKIEKYNLTMPNTIDSLTRDIKMYTQIV